MGEKIIIIFLILFVMSGILVYDKYVMEHGGISPIGKILDSAGISQFAGLRESRVKIIQRHYEMSMNNNLAMLAQRHKEMDEKRMELMKHRSEILDRVAQMNEQLNAEAGKYFDVLSKEQQDFIKHCTELEKNRQAIKGLSPTSENGSKDQWSGPYGRMQDLWTSVLQDHSGILEEESPLRKRIERIMKEEYSPPWVSEMDKITLDLQNSAQENLNMTAKDFSEVKTLVEKLNKELNIFKENTQASEQLLQGYQEKIDGDLQQMTRGLFQITLKDMQELLDLYRSFQDEQALLLDNVCLNWQRLYSAQAFMDQRVREILQRVGDSADRLTSYGQVLKEQRDLMQEVETAENQLHAAIKNRWDANREHLGELAKFVSLDIEKSLPEKKDQAVQRVNKPSSTSLQAQAVRVHSQEQGIAPRAPLIPLGETRAPSSVWNKYDDLMDKTKDQGF